ncbi:wd repeat domain phosphoinositide-interacting protein [Cyclospora cayetanensis]|uniref:Wd repeat domain phosphoinositide-interacting protein n=1 Tax=Cyclospora cayetanensis TaxID=88456 RepID=A0A1D3CRT4_9EIME|nr:wd repeat domain phosphoinositide-interacting protein [Cyclospora cayetanensis]
MPVVLRVTDMRGRDRELKRAQMHAPGIASIHMGGVLQQQPSYCVYACVGCTEPFKKTFQRGGWDEPCESSCTSVIAAGMAGDDLIPANEEGLEEELPCSIALVEMLYTCNILAVVGSGNDELWQENVCVLWDDRQARSIVEMRFATRIIGVTMLREALLVVLENKVCIYLLRGLSLVDSVLTAPNPSGLCVAATTATSTQEQQKQTLVVACPGRGRMCGAPPAGSAAADMRLRLLKGPSDTERLHAAASCAAASCAAASCAAASCAAASAALQKGTVQVLFYLVSADDSQGMPAGGLQPKASNGVYRDMCRALQQRLKERRRSLPSYKASLSVKITDSALVEPFFVERPPEIAQCPWDGSLLASASVKGTLVRIFSSASGQLLKEVRRGVNPALITCLCISPCNGLLAVCSNTGTLHLFHFSENFAAVCAFGQEPQSILALTADGCFYKLKYDANHGGTMSNQGLALTAVFWIESLGHLTLIDLGLIASSR